MTTLELKAKEFSRQLAGSTPDVAELERGFKAYLEHLGATVGDVRWDADGLVEIVIHWRDGGWQILSPRMAHKGQ